MNDPKVRYRNAGMRYVYFTHDPHLACATDKMEILTAVQLNTLLEMDGLLVKKREKVELAHPVTGAKVKLEFLTLVQPAESRAVSISQQRRDERQTEERALRRRDEDEEGGRANQVVSSGSYLGDTAFSVPGVGKVSGNAGQMAFGLGVDSAKLGGSSDENPFPAGSLPHEEWMRGFMRGGGTEAAEVDKTSDAYQLGKRAARGPDDLEVSCPYPNGSTPFKAWVQGFIDNGGKLEH